MALVFAIRNSPLKSPKDLSVGKMNAQCLSDFSLESCDLWLYQHLCSNHEQYRSNKGTVLFWLDDIIKSIPSEDKLILLGDVNSRIGKDCEAWSGVVKPNEWSQKNDSNGFLLVSKCAEHDLTWPTQSLGKSTNIIPLGCIQNQRTITWLTMSLYSKRISGTLRSQKQCKGQTVGLITGWSQPFLIYMLLSLSETMLNR